MEVKAKVRDFCRVPIYGNDLYTGMFLRRGLGSCNCSLILPDRLRSLLGYKIMHDELLESIGISSQL